MTKRLSLFAIVATALLLPTGCGPSTTPDIHWDTGPDTLIIRYWDAVRICCYDSDNLIPPLQIWGDGRVIWLGAGSVAFERQMMVGYLTQEQVHELLQYIVEAGFFEWNEEYFFSAAPPDFDYLVVNLASHSEQPKRVAVDWADIADEPEGFSSLKQLMLAVPASVTNAEIYTPDSAYLETQAIPPEWGDCSSQWPETGYDLSQATSGMHIEGKALAATWEAVNEYLCRPVCMQSDEGAFSVKLVIPGVSLRSEQLHPAFAPGAPACR